MAERASHGRERQRLGTAVSQGRLDRATQQLVNTVNNTYTKKVDIYED